MYQLNKSLQCNQQTEPNQCKSEVEEMYSPKPRSQQLRHLYLKINTGQYARENPSEEAISESTQIRELHETIKFLNEKVMLSNTSAKTFIFKCK